MIQSLDVSLIEVILFVFCWRIFGLGWVWTRISSHRCWSRCTLRCLPKFIMHLVTIHCFFMHCMCCLKDWIRLRCGNCQKQFPLSKVPFSAFHPCNLAFGLFISRVLIVKNCSLLSLIQLFFFFWGDVGVVQLLFVVVMTGCGCFCWWIRFQTMPVWKIHEGPRFDINHTCQCQPLVQHQAW